MSIIEIFNHRHLRLRRQRMKARFSQHDFLFDWAAEQTAERLSDIKRDFTLGMALGARGRDKLETLVAHRIENLIFSDPVMGDILADSELPAFRFSSADIVLSMLELHNANDLPGALTQIRKTLKPDGVFIACLFGGETLYELRDSFLQAELSLQSGASPRVAPFADKQQIAALMQRAGFSLPVVDAEIIRVSYEDAFRLMADLRGMGESNILKNRRDTFTPKSLFAEMAAYYHDKYAEEDCRVTASFEIIFMIGWAPHESQPQPLRRGSADISLSEVLQ